MECKHKKLFFLIVVIVVLFFVLGFFLFSTKNVLAGCCTKSSVGARAACAGIPDFVCRDGSRDGQRCDATPDCPDGKCLDCKNIQDYPDLSRFPYTFSSTGSCPSPTSFLSMCSSVEVLKMGEKKPEPEKERPFVPPTLQIPIPGLTLTTEESKLKFCTECTDSNVDDPVDCPKEKCKSWAYSIPWIGEYIGAFYKWAVGALAILAVIMIMISGIRWLIAGGSPEKISSAKQSMVAAVSGLVFMLIVHQVLAMINPELTILKPIVIGVIKRVEVEDASADQAQQQQEAATKTGLLRSASDINSIVIHYSGGSSGSAAAFREYHKSKHWADIGYHFVICNGNGCPDGEIQTGRNILWAGAHAKNTKGFNNGYAYNFHSIGINFVGGTRNQSYATSMTKPQLESLVGLINRLMKEYNISYNSIFPHNVISSTDCPGFNDWDKFINYVKAHP